MKCKLKCFPEAIDSQSHLLRCPKVLEELEPAEMESIKIVKYSDIFGSLEQQRKVILSLMRIMEIRTKLIEKESQKTDHKKKLNKKEEKNIRKIGTRH